MRTHAQRRSTIAVIGAGAAGLTAAHGLAGHHDVTVFEAAARAGGHAWTIDVEGTDGPVGADVGFMVFNDRTYPRFEALLARLGVASRASEMSFSVSDGRDFEYAGHGVNGLFATRRHLADRAFWRMAGEYVRFNREARALLASDADPGLREWLAGRGFSELFVERLIVPQAAAVWSADPEQLWSFPARFLVRFFDNHGMLSFRGRPEWRTVTGGSRAYVGRIAAVLGDRLRLATPVASVAREAGGVVVTPRDGAPERFDEVVLACHADQALALLADASPAETAVLGALRYAPSELALHADAALLPRRRAARASWNYHLLDTPAAGPTVTYDLARLQGLRAGRPVLATLNRTDAIDPALIDTVVEVAHPVITPESVRAQARRDEVSGVRRTHYCGAYWTWGFHEDAVASAEHVVRAIAGGRPDADAAGEAALAAA